MNNSEKSEIDKNSDDFGSSVSSKIEDTLNNLGIDFDFHDDGEYLIRYERIKNVTCSELPEGLTFYPVNNEDDEILIAQCILSVTVQNGAFVISLQESGCAKFFSSTIGMQLYYSLKQELLKKNPEYPVSIDVDDDGNNIHITYDFTVSTPTLDAAIAYAVRLMDDIEERLSVLENEVETFAKRSLGI